MLKKTFLLGRLETVNLSCTYSRVKIIGTLLCVIGALTMSIVQSIYTPVPAKEGTVNLSPPPPGVMFDRQKILGCLYLLAGVFIFSGTMVLQVTFNQIGKKAQTSCIKFHYSKQKLWFLQAFTLGDFPAPVSLCVITSFFGSLMTAAVQLLEDHEFKTGWPMLGVGDLIIYSLLVISTSLFLFQMIICSFILKKGGLGLRLPLSGITCDL